MSGPTKLCLGCSAIGTWGKGGRCESCRLALQRERESNPRRRAIKRARYDADHRRLRKLWQRALMAVGSTPCARCGEPIYPTDAWDLDHLASTSRPSHAACNRAAPHQKHTKEITR